MDTFNRKENALVEASYTTQASVSEFWQLNYSHASLPAPSITFENLKRGDYSFLKKESDSFGIICQGQEN